MLKSIKNIFEVAPLTIFKKETYLVVARSPLKFSTPLATLLGTKSLYLFFIKKKRSGFWWISRFYFQTSSRENANSPQIKKNSTVIADRAKKYP